jgi:hypothetical protein
MGWHMFIDFNIREFFEELEAKDLLKEPIKMDLRCLI